MAATQETTREAVPAQARRLAAGPARLVEAVGRQTAFYGRSYAAVPRVLKRYRGEVLTQLGAVTFGSGNLARIGGTAVVMTITLAAAGVEGTQLLYKSLELVGIQVYTGFLAGFADIRIVLPIITSVTLVATVGAGFTAEIGARRISEEIDALEVMAVPPLPYLVTTRVIAGAIAIVPLFAISLIAMFTASKVRTVVAEGLPAGTYDHYFTTFLLSSDILIAFVQTLISVVAVMSIHTYYGFHATGGPAGVGQAVGRSVRLSLIVVLFLMLASSLLLYGNSDSLHLSR
jgi:ABC-type transport system involved in resistance to organic solvents, permease component